MPQYEIGGKRPTLAADAWVSPTADLVGEVQLKEGASVWFGAVIRADNTPILIGARTNVQEGAMLHSDPDAPLVVGDGVTVGHHAVLHGCTVGDDCLIGMGAILLNGALIGAGSIVGAGALVTEGKQFPAGSLIVGSPARAIRQLGPDTLAVLRASADLYVAKAKQFASGLKRVD